MQVNWTQTAKELQAESEKEARRTVTANKLNGVIDEPVTWHDCKDDYPEGTTLEEAFRKTFGNAKKLGLL